MPDFLKAALTLLERDWLAMPLTLDGQGFPKRPIVQGWPDLWRDEETIRSLPWSQAKGMGIVLGHPSDGLAVIDIDDVDLAGAALFVLGDESGCRTVRTIRQRCHVYVQQYSEVSESSVRTVKWQGTTIKIELKSDGTQVAAPPTPGYALVGRGRPWLHDSVETAWAALAQMIGRKYPGLLEVGSNERYPKPWAPFVQAGERDKAAYVEAHRLREAGLALEQAMAYMKIRWEKDYEVGEQGWQEIERTIESAYNKGSDQAPYEGVSDDIAASLFRGGNLGPRDTARK